MRRILLVVVALTLWPTSAAHASEIPSWISQIAPQGVSPPGPEYEVVYQIAIEHWGAEPSLCESVTKFEAPMLVNEGEEFVGWATIPKEPVPCFIILRQDPDFLNQCRIAVHEVGHLLGLEHTPELEVTSIMHPAPTITPQGCSDEYNYRILQTNLKDQRARCLRLRQRRANLRTLLYCLKRVKIIQKRIART